MMKSATLKTKPQPHLSLPGEGGALALEMLLAGLAIGFAVTVHGGTYNPLAIFGITIALLAVIAGAFVPRGCRFDRLCPRALPAALIIAVFAEIGLFLLLFAIHPNVPYDTAEPVIALVKSGVVLVALIAAVSIFRPNFLRWTRLMVALALFWILGAAYFTQLFAQTGIDVYVGQQTACSELLQGHNPYEMRPPNYYPDPSAVYAPGMVDEHNRLTFGYLYLPLSLLMDLPGYILGDDCRWSVLTLLVLSAGLMAWANPGPTGALAAIFLLLVPFVFSVVSWAYTDVAMLFSFSLVLACACRWKSALPYVLGIFLATKQYSILALPAVFLLAEGPRQWRNYSILLLKAGALAAVITLPFVLWNPHEFYRSVILFQLLQPFRGDAISYLVWWCSHFGPPALMPPDTTPYLKWFNAQFGHAFSAWTPLAALIPATGLALWRFPRTPAGFAAAVMLTNLAFFAFAKQAFENYYFFIFGAACWAIAAWIPDKAQLPVSKIQPI